MKNSFMIMVSHLMMVLMLVPTSDVHAISHEKNVNNFAHTNRPIVGVSGSGEISKSVRYTMAALWDAGAYPILLDARKPQEIKQHISVLNGIVIAGNSLDINNEDYRAPAHEKTKNEDELADDPWETYRDDYEYALIERGIKHNIPLLGICSGAQRLNVANHHEDGGTLRQHIDNHLIPPDQHRPIAVVEGSRLAGVVVSPTFRDNSFHHQHIEAVREGFRVAARDGEDGIVEAIEADPNGKYGDHPFLMGVQWHPEYGMSDESRTLIQSLADAAKTHAKAHPVSIDNARWHDQASPALRKAITLGVDGMMETYGFKDPDWITRVSHPTHERDLIGVAP